MSKPRENDTSTTSAPAASHSSQWLYRIPIFLAIYLLSLGPGARLEMALPASQNVINILYYPVRVLCAHCEPVATALMWYLAVIWKVPLDI